MKLLLFFLLAVSAAFSQNTKANNLEIIPSTNGQSVGTVKFVTPDRSHNVSLSGPPSLDANLSLVLPFANTVAVSASNPLYLYTHFRDDNTTLFLDYSRDLLNYKPVSNDAVYDKIYIRDPSLFYSPTSQTFWVIVSQIIPCTIQITSSQNLINWSTFQTIDLHSYLSGCTASTSPEWFIDPTDGSRGFWVSMSDGGVTQWSGAHYFAFDPDTDGTTPTAHAAVTVNGTIPLTVGLQNIGDFFEYYDTASASYYLLYANFQPGNGGQRINYASSSTKTGTYTQHKPTTTPGNDWFGFGPPSSVNGFAEAPAVVPIPDSTSLFGVPGCVRVYADTFAFLWPVAGTDGSTGNRRYQLRYVDTCPTTAGADPFGVVEPAPGTVRAANPHTGSGATVTWDSGAQFGAFDGGGGNGNFVAITGPVIIDGTSYPVTSVSSPSVLMLTGNAANTACGGPTTPADNSNATPSGCHQQALIPGVTSPVKLSQGEGGSFIAITDPAVAQIVYVAEDYFRRVGVEQPHRTIGNADISSPFALTVESRHTSAYLTNNESPTVAAGGPDTSAIGGTKSYATWSACGGTLVSCPNPIGNTGTWIETYLSSAPGIQMNNISADHGETAISFANGQNQFGVDIVTGAAIGNKAYWKIGSNNQCFGPIGSCGNIFNNWFYLFNASTPAGETNLTVNPGFETGSLTGWGITGTVSVVNTVAHYGSYSAKVTAGSSVYQSFTGLTANAKYQVLAWIWNDFSSTSGTFIDVSNAAVTNDYYSGPYLTHQWYQIGAQYTADSSGTLLVKFTHCHLRTCASETDPGYAYVDDLQVFSLATEGGSFPLAISPQTGEVRANYGFTVGGKEGTASGTLSFANFDANASGDVNIGNGQLGNNNALVKAGGYIAYNFPITIYENNFGGNAGLNIIGKDASSNWPIISYSFVDTSPAIVIGAQVFGQIMSNTAGAGAMDLVFSTMNAGSMSQRMRITAAGQIQMAGLVTSPGFNIVSGSALQYNATAITNSTNWIGGIADTLGPAKIYEGIFGGGIGIDIIGGNTGSNWPLINLSLTNTASAIVAGGQIFGQIMSNTAGSESMDLVFSTMNSGTLTQRMRITASGLVETANTVISPGFNLVSGSSLEYNGTPVTSGTTWTGGISGASGSTVTVRNSAGTGTCTIIFGSNGVRTGGTC